MTRSILLGLSLGLLASGACFSAPSADVQFSCDPVDAPACPDGYTCQDDGCCHRDGSDVEANEGGCRLVSTGGATDTATGTAGTGTSTSSGTGTGTSSSSSSGTETSGTDTAAGSSSGGSSGTDSGTG